MYIYVAVVERYDVCMFKNASISNMNINMLY